MKFVDDFRNPQRAEKYIRAISDLSTQHWKLMEVCGGQTHAIVKNGIDRRLSDSVTLIHGPGCPVCVTPAELIDQALELALRPDVILCTFGDMLRVRGSSGDLLSAKANGADMRTLYSPLDSLQIARSHPDKEVVFFAIGFETTAPVNAGSVLQANQAGIGNFSLLCAQVLIPPAIEAILGAPDCRIQGLLAPGHVCSVMGCAEYAEISKRFGIPVVVTGFEPLDILQGIYMVVKQLERGEARLENQYTRAVTQQGNKVAQEMVHRVFTTCDFNWRGIGTIASSGLVMREEYAPFDAAKKFGLKERSAAEKTVCISGLIMQGQKKPFDCPAFGGSCTPEIPLGAPMVSSEGACAAYYRYSRLTGGGGRLA